MMKHDSFCVLILSNGRPRQTVTVDALSTQGYTGDWRVVVDDEDPTLAEYIDQFGEDRVIIFHKQKYIAECDAGDNFPNSRTILYPRNAAFDIARDLGVEAFLELDDDYRNFQFRFFNEEKQALDYRYVPDLDAVFDTMLDFLDDSGADSVALAQGGDYIGGALGSKWQEGITRKAMNTFFIKTDATFRFMGRMNEDVTCYTTLATRGRLFFTTMYCHIWQERTQVSPGGLSEEYLARGTYIKTFYAVMMCPSAVKVWILGNNDSKARIHHRVRWRTCTPKILHESYRKASVSPLGG